MISTKEKCTVHIIFDKPVKSIFLYNEKGQVYYARAFNPSVKSCQINIADKGIYRLVSDSSANYNFKIAPLAKYTPVSLPAPQYNKIKNVRIIHDNSIGKTPAQIHIPTAIIKVNDDFLRYPLFSQRFIIEHEIGHLQYGSEHFADKYAHDSIMRKGGNKSSNLFTLMFVLRRSPLNMDRIKNMIGTINS